MNIQETILCLKNFRERNESTLSQEDIQCISKAIDYLEKDKIADALKLVLTVLSFVIKSNHE